MRVLITCHVRFASAMAWYALSLARGLRAAGHEVLLSAQRGSPLADWAKAEQLPLDDRFNYHSTNPLELRRATRALHHSLAQFRPDVLNPHCPPGHALLAWVNRRRALPLIRAVAEPRPPKGNRLNKLLHERYTDGMIYSTASSLPRYAAAFDLASVPQAVILAGLDLQRFPRISGESWREKLRIPNDVVFGAIVARMSPEKGQELLFEALALLEPDVRSKLVVLLTGDDSRQRTAKQLLTLATSKGVGESLRFAPRVPDVRVLLDQIDLGIITSVRSEAVCRIALEYMAYGKPIIATDVNVLAEVVRNAENGWSVPVYDPTKLAEALREAILRRDELARRGAAGRDVLEREFLLEHQTRSTIEFFQEMIKRRG